MGTPESLANQMNGTSNRLIIKCGACDHRAEYLRADAWRIWGMHATPHAIRRRAKCILCGERNRIAVSIT